MNDFGVVEIAGTCTNLFDHAQRLFPVMCHFEGWEKPSEIDFDRLKEVGWSNTNPGFSAWDKLEGEMCRSVDMAAAAMAATGADLSVLGDNAMSLEKGDLVNHMAHMVRKELAARKFEEVFGDAFEANS